LLASQIEYRLLPFSFSKRWGASIFFAAGEVFNSEEKFKFNNLLPTAGAGLRFLLFPEKDFTVGLTMQLRVKAVAYISLLERHFKPKKKGSLRTHLSCKKNNLIFYNFK
jgi:hypothetical protein